MSPHRTRPSASPFTARTSSRKRPCWSSRQWRSPTAARRKLRIGLLLRGRAPGLAPGAQLGGAKRLRVLVPEVLEDVLVLHLRHERPAADALLPVALGERLHGAPQELAHDALGHLGALAREGEAVEHELREQDLPVLVEARDEPVPVHLVAAGAHEVRDVVAVEALALADEALRPDHL